MAAEHLSYSRAELTALLFKAGRGAGLPLAHAEDLGRAVGRHGDEAAFAAVLRSLEAPWTDIDLHLEGQHLTIRNARAIQALSHVAEALSAGVVRVTLRNLDEAALVGCYLHGAAITAEEDGTDWHFTSGDPAEHAGASLPRPDQIAALDAYAALTYVPASDASRSGAGQGADQD